CTSNARLASSPMPLRRWLNGGEFISIHAPKVESREPHMKARILAAGAVLGVFALLSAASFAAAEKKDVLAIESAVGGSWRSADAKARDTQRHPVDALEFWGLKPGMTILEIQPGGGWWTEVLAPYARANKSQFYATAADLADPGLSEGAKKGRA